MKHLAADIVREYFPDATDQFVDYVLWERTGWPSFWQGNPVECLRGQVLDFREALKLGRRLCDFCNKPAEIRGLCVRCFRALNHACNNATEYKTFRRMWE